MRNPKNLKTFGGVLSCAFLCGLHFQTNDISFLWIIALVSIAATDLDKVSSVCHSHFCSLGIGGLAVHHSWDLKQKFKINCGLDFIDSSVVTGFSW
jgi:hypothetical protein